MPIHQILAPSCNWVIEFLPQAAVACNLIEGNPLQHNSHNSNQLMQLNIICILVAVFPCQSPRRTKRKQKKSISSLWNSYFLGETPYSVLASPPQVAPCGPWTVGHLHVYTGWATDHKTEKVACLSQNTKMPLELWNPNRPAWSVKIPLFCILLYIYSEQTQGVAPQIRQSREF